MNQLASRQRAPRQHAQMALIFDRGDKYVAANLVDISESGVLLLADETAPLGKQVTLYADLNDHTSWPIHIDGVVVRCGDDNVMAIRLLYASVAQLAQMRLFLQALTESVAPVLPAVVPETIAVSSSTQQPRAARLPLRGLYGILDLDERYSAGEVVDLSETGFFLATGEALGVGQKLSFIPHSCNDTALPFDLEAQVVRVDAARGVACRFAALSATELQALRTFLHDASAVRSGL